jgi:hypothetical protein
LKILGHWQTTVKPYTSSTNPGTDCPGAGIFGQITAGQFGYPKTPQPPVEDDPVTLQEIKAIADNVTDQIKGLDLVGQMLNYPVPMPDGGTADFWSLVVDGRQRTMALQDTVAQLRTELATAQADIARLTDVVDGP